MELFVHFRMEDCSDYGNEHSSFMEGGGYVDSFNNRKFLKYYSAQ
jgi:hypothetical protein